MSATLASRLFAAGTALIVLAGCGREAAPPQPPKVVRILVAGETATADERTYSGEVRARHETTLAFRTGGKIVARLADVGAAVRTGQPLARLDPTDAALQSAQAEAQRTLAAA
ncbi:MAG: biotin/lipoyl-binding protein, partial [Rhodocyclaceae bacterium]|nr:biotin/lipoyl-binding protein [Rhodocyclaceae bacterium]